MNYRKRCYESFITTHWNYTHSLSKEEFQLYAKVSKKRFKNILPIDKASRIIDVACGSGHFLYFLQKQGYVNTQGIDLSLEQIENAKKVGVKNYKKQIFSNIFLNIRKVSIWLLPMILSNI